MRLGTWLILIVFAFLSFPVTAGTAPEHRCEAADMNQRGEPPTTFGSFRTAGPSR